MIYIKRNTKAERGDQATSPSDHARPQVMTERPPQTLMLEPVM